VPPLTAFRFDDCLKLGKRIDERPYLLPNPEILRKSATDDVKVPNTSEMEGATAPRPESLPNPADTPSSRRLHVFNEKKVMLSEDLALGSRLRGIIEDLIEGGGGTITTTVHKADIYVCHFRDGKDYVTASRRGKDVGNLAWLYHLITHNEWTSPLRRLMHYPMPRKAIPGFEKFRITLSNYGGEARMYLENLVIAAGGEFTKSMRQENTHLITARLASEKCNAAREWGIDMINHLWVEESYAKCKVQPLSNPRYTHFPPRTNLGEVIGQTQFDRAALERIYFPEDPDESPELPKLARSVMQTKDSNAALTRGDSAFAANHAETSGSDVTRNSPKRRSSAAPTPSRMPPTVTPLTNRLIGIGKENETPSSASSRGAKDRALSKLHDMAPDVALYEKEKKRGGGGVWGGKRAANSIDRENSRKRSSSSVDVVEVDAAEEEEHGSKRVKTGAPRIDMRLLITGYKRWLASLAKEEADRVSRYL
jgi:twin BRCT domain